jgi:hypothetical protein
MAKNSVCANCGFDRGYLGSDEFLHCMRCNCIGWKPIMNMNTNEAPMPGQELEVPELEIGALVPSGGEVVSGPVGIPRVDATASGPSLADVLEADKTASSALIHTGRSRSA